jgi:Vault protein inter-alpha-trypsin domain
VTIGDRKVVTQTKRKAEAEQEYSHAVQQGHTAVLAKQVRLTSDKTLSTAGRAGISRALTCLRTGLHTYMHHPAWCSGY